MGRIQRLTDELANQIAAGEVVERPSSVVKELVENALDAGATRVVVDVELGGTTLVRVSDDGDGMSPEDAVLCLERHATSKIARFDDLSDLGTFGFRGEALPSIASVSRLTLVTRPRGADEGVEVRVEGGGRAVARPIGAAVGTAIEVRELFFNVPARRKFLKATATESAHVSDVLLGLALARHDVTFVLTRDGRPVREHLRVGTRAERARSVMTAMWQNCLSSSTTRMVFMFPTHTAAVACAVNVGVMERIPQTFFGSAVPQLIVRSWRARMHRSNSSIRGRTRVANAGSSSARRAAPSASESSSRR